MADPLLPEPSNLDPADWIIRQQQNTQSAALGALDDDPDQAARAKQLADVTGADPALVHGDLENFEQQHKAALTSSLLQNNAFLRQYATNVPLAASVSNDDWGQLDKISAVNSPGNVLAKAWEGLKEGWGEQDLQPEREIDKQFLAKLPFKLRIVGEEIIHAPEVISRLFNAGIHAVAKGGAQAITPPGSDPQKAEEALESFIEWRMIDTAGHVAMHPPEFTPEQWADVKQQAEKLIKDAGPYIADGKPPPPGVHEVVDQLWSQQAKDDVKGLGDEIKEWQKSTTRERSPETAAEFARMLDQGSIGISAEAVRALYGDEVPAVGDGKLGDLPNIAQQLRTAEMIGGDVVVPKADFVTKVEPEVWKALQDHIRVRSEGMTVREVDAMKDYREATKVQAPSGDYVQQLAKGEVSLPSSQELGNIIGSTREADKQGMDEATYTKLESLNRRIDQGDDRAVKEKQELLKTVPEQEEPNIPSMDQLKVLQTEFSALEKQATEGQTEYADGIARVLKRYLGGVTSGEPLATAVFRKAFEEAKAHGIDTRKLGNDVIQRFLGDLSEGDQRVMKEQFDKFLSPKLPKPEDFELPSPSAQTDLARREAQLDPMAETGQTIRIARVSSEIPEDGGEPFHTYDLYGDRGKVGNMTVQLTPKNLIYVENIEGYGPREPGQPYGGAQPGFGPNAFGLTQMKGVFRQLANEFPTATHVGGYRVTGARDKAGTTAWVQVPIAHLRTRKGLADFMEDIGWRGQQGLVNVLPEGAKGGQTVSWVEDPTREAKSIVSFKGSDVIDRLDTSHLTGIPRALHDFFGDRIQRLAGNVDVHVISDADMERFSGSGTMNGYYDGHQIVLKESMVDGREPDWFTTHVVMHELAHAATVEAMYADPKINAAVVKLMGEARTLLEQSASSALRKHGYAFKNEREFMAEAMSKPGFQEQLARTPISKELASELGLQHKTGSVWDAVKEIIKNLFRQLTGREPPNTVLDGIFAVGEAIEKSGVTPFETKGVFAHEGDRPDPVSIRAEIERLRELRAKKFDEVTAAMERGDTEAAEKAKAEVQAMDKPISDLAAQLPMKTTQLVQDKTGKWVVPPREQGPDPELFAKASAIGMTAEQFGRYMKLIEKRNAEDTARAEARAEAASQTRLSEQWKEAEPKVREQVEQDIAQRPDILADDFFRKGMFNGEDTGKRYKLLDSALTDEQRAALPKSLVGPNGINPVDIAGLFGFVSGNQMVDALGTIEATRQRLGVGHGDFRERLIRDEVQRRLVKQFGDPKAQSLSEAREDILTSTQMDLLHEEMLALGMKSGQAPPMTKEMTKAWVGSEFKTATIAQARDMEGYLRTAGRAGRAAELALLKGDPTEAFRQKQQQYLAVSLADEAKRLGRELDKAQRAFDRLSSRRTISTMPQDFVDQLHGIMGQIGVGHPRNPTELAGALRDKPLREFVAEKTSWLGEMPVADFLMDPAYQKKINAMTVEEFRAVHDSVQTMMHNARAEKTLQIADRRETMEELVDEARAQVEDMSRRYLPREPGKIDRLKSTAYHVDASLIRIEQLLDWLDKEDPQGVYNRTVFRPLSDAKHVENDMRKEIGGKIKALPTEGINWGRAIEHPELKDWHTAQPMHLTERDLVGMMLNMGTEVNYKKLTAEFKYENSEYQLFTPDQLEAVVARNATKAHWDYAQAVWDMFEGLWPKVEEVSRRVSGIAPDKKVARPITTPFGDYAGGYYPLIADGRWVRPGETLERGLFSEDKYTRGIPPKGYTKQVTGATYPLELNPQFATKKVMETVHDLAFREALLNAKRFLDQAEIRRSIDATFGPEYRKQLPEWLNDVANPAAMYAVNNRILSGIESIARGARQRLVAVQLLYRASTIMKHSVAAALDTIGEVGFQPFVNEMLHFYAQPWRTGDRIDWVMDKSGELRNRVHDLDRDIGEMLDRSLGSNGLYASALHYGSIGVATLDIGTAIPTWMVAYKKALLEGATDADAVYAGDKAVRTAHGASGVTDLPAIMRGSEVSKLFTVAYGFFNHNYNRIRNIGRLLGKEGVAGDLADGEFRSAFTKFQRAAWMSTWYVVLMAAIEEGVTPAPGEEREGWGSWAMRGVFHQLSSTVPFVRDVAGFMLGRSRPTDPVSQIGEAVFKPLADTKRYMDQGKTSEYIKNLVKHAPIAGGYLLGIPGMGQVQQTTDFLWDLEHGKQRATGTVLGRGFGSKSNVVPLGYGSLARGLLLGKSEPDRRTR